MSIFQKVKNVVADYPAFKVVELTPNRAGFVELKSCDELYNIDTHSSYMIDSVVSYAIANNEDPIDAFNHAFANSHKCHFVIAVGTLISSSPTKSNDKISIVSGMKIKFEGKYFELVTVDNNNYDLKEIING